MFHSPRMGKQPSATLQQLTKTLWTSPHWAVGTALTEDQIDFSLQ